MSSPNKATKRCAYKEGSRRCFRNGFGNPPLCRAHAIQVNLDGREMDSEEGEGLPSSLFTLIDLADRAFSQSNSEFARQVRGIFGEYLSQTANQRNASRVPRTPPPPPPRPAPPREDNPREILGFEPNEPLDRAKIKKRQRDLAMLFHPDKGGSVAAMRRVNAAADALLEKL